MIYFACAAGVRNQALFEPLEKDEEKVKAEERSKTSATRRIDNLSGLFSGRSCRKMSGWRGKKFQDEGSYQDEMGFWPPSMPAAWSFRF